MKKIELGEGGTLVLETILTKGQVSKFNKLVENLIIEDGVAYVPMNELHGVLLTNSRQRAKTIVENHRDIVKNFLVRDKVRFQKYKISSAIKPVGLYQLLEKLADENPQRASEYRASLALLAYIIAKHPQLSFSASAKAKQKSSEANSIASKLKRKYNYCQLCNQIFTSEDEKHIHHIEGKSEDPSLVNEEDNLIVINGRIHDDYHNWLNAKGWPINRGTLKYYAKEKGYLLEGF